MAETGMEQGSFAPPGLNLRSLNPTACALTIIRIWGNLLVWVEVVVLPESLCVLEGTKIAAWVVSFRKRESFRF
jgi:hypothetical protein